jgi:catechol 2,3-dioxygenase-like lactoylglutathione lyase family enzyme
MPPVYTYDHMHLRSRDPKATAQYYHQMFDAKIIESIQSDGRPRIDLDLNGLTIFIAQIPPEADIPSAPTTPYVGLDHFGLRVNNMDEAVAELKRRGATFAVEPRTIRPGVRIAFVQAPENVRIELLERT